MYKPPTEKQLSKIPTYDNCEGTEFKDRIIHEHFFLGGSDWYITSYEPDTEIFFGFVILNGDTDMSEWGDISFEELKEVKMQGVFEVDRDKYWKKKKACEVDKIKELI